MEYRPDKKYILAFRSLAIDIEMSASTAKPTLIANDEFQQLTSGSDIDHYRMWVVKDRHAWRGDNDSCYNKPLLVYYAKLKQGTVHLQYAYGESGPVIFEEKVDDCDSDRFLEIRSYEELKIYASSLR